MLVCYSPLAGASRPSCANSRACRIIIAKGCKSDSSNSLHKLGTAAARQEERQGAAPSGNYAFIAYARPVTIT